MRARRECLGFLTDTQSASLSPPTARANRRNKRLDKASPPAGRDFGARVNAPAEHTSPYRAPADRPARSTRFARDSSLEETSSGLPVEDQVRNFGGPSGSLSSAWPSEMIWTFAAALGRHALAATILKLMWSSSAGDAEPAAIADPADINISVELSKAVLRACRCICFTLHMKNISGKLRKVRRSPLYACKIAIAFTQRSRLTPVEPVNIGG
jgi:hypothetical protein